MLPLPIWIVIRHTVDLAWAAMNSGVLAVIVDNDNLRAEDMEPYVVEVSLLCTLAHFLC